MGSDAVVGADARTPLGRAGVVVRRLVDAYYANGTAEPVGASSHWSAFSERFDVWVDEEGDVVRLAGYGFGDSHRASIVHRIVARAGVALQLATLGIGGLGAAVARGRETVRAMGLQFSQDAFRQVCTAYILTRRPDVAALIGGPPHAIVMTGDGHGILSALLHVAFPMAQIWLVDLGPTLVFQAYHLGWAFPTESHALAEDAEGPPGTPTFIYCPAERADAFLPGRIDLAVNVASMQEMTPDAVAGYFTMLRSRHTTLLYCCNRLEKRLPGGELLRFLTYPWSPAARHLIDEAAPWHQFFVGRAPSPHLRVAGIPIPLVHRYDGLHWHRLTHLAPSA